MSEHVTTCATGCDRPSGGYFLCRECTRELVAAIRAVPALTTQLEIATARQTRTGTGVGVASRSAERPLPVNLAAADVARDLSNVLGVWTRDIAERTGHELTATDTASAAVWLLGRVSTLRTHPAADELHDECTDAIARAWRIVDRAPALHFAGPCDDCGADLYARPLAAWLQCVDCGADYDAADRREWLLDNARDQLVTAAEAARALPGLLGHPLTPAMIRGYAHRGRLAARPADRAGHPRYRVGDIIDVVVSIHDTVADPVAS